jgi:hypothetical protein
MFCSKTRIAGTKTVNGFRLQDGETNYVLVDTPGLNDTALSDTDIVNTIIDWLEKTYRNNSKLNAILYLHPITDLRIQGSAIRNLRMFRKLCGDSSLKNVVLATSFWDKVTTTEGEKREQQLIIRKDFWQGMISKGCRVERLKDHRAAGLDLLRSLKVQGKMKTDVQVQIVDQGLPRSKTNAVKVINQDLQQLQLKNENERSLAKEEAARKLNFQETMRRWQVQEQRERHKADILNKERIREKLEEAYRRQLVEDENRRQEENYRMAFFQQNLMLQRQQEQHREWRRQQEAQSLRASQAEALRQLRLREAEALRWRERQLEAQREAHKHQASRVRGEQREGVWKGCMHDARGEACFCRKHAKETFRLDHNRKQNEPVWEGCEHDARGAACFCWKHAERDWSV